MDYTDWLWLKLIGFAVAAFIWGFKCGNNGLDLTGRPHTEPRDKADQEQPNRDDPAARA